MKPRIHPGVAGAIGNVLEWYDFGLYGLLAPVLAKVFFPARSGWVGLLAVYGGFAAGFAMRPLGAWVLGAWGDRRGRKVLLTASVALMGIATVAVGVLPSYAAFGVWAPALLIATRLFQGFSVGGEFVGSVTYLVESATPQRRGWAGSIANLGSTGGMLLAAGAAALVATWARPGQLVAWVWRMPFLAGGVLALAAFLLRRRLPDIGPAPQSGRDEQPPLTAALRDAPRTMLLVTLFCSGYGIVDYLTMVYLPTFAHGFGQLSQALVLRVNTAGQALALLVVPLAGWLSDWALRRRTLLAAAFICEALAAWSLFALAGSGSGGFWTAQLLFAAMLAVIMGAGPAMLAEQFPAAYRVTGHAVAFNVGIGMAGGTAPLVAVAFIHASGTAMAAAVYLGFAAVLAAGSILLLPDRSREPLLEAQRLDWIQPGGLLGGIEAEENPDASGK
ncbi:MAG: MFS transporter [Terriglobales bacterium]